MTPFIIGSARFARPAGWSRGHLRLQEVPKLGVPFGIGLFQFLPMGPVPCYSQPEWFRCLFQVIFPSPDLMTPTSFADSWLP
ncbi:hypothetical protein EVAR_26558_1 [Eumeta japonica]|uniref:Uncharacterized protein n=1 Tax=Eumeta variegata TaxID=151549 RepID=A0A4C1W531_EUMVA|nr:hypothetical protein EVAR_26558_1 [Eumeta japonica]